ncbi:MAG TPA: hypothetical protein VLE73_00060 [Candidatus Saccharimonadales bacterium]|nr:hypothetical protein [Candidatus Saccharimonadales bacterium]
MRKLHIMLAGIAFIGVASASTVAVYAANAQPSAPSWIAADGKVDYKKMPDDVRIPYTCWNGKKTTLTGKEMKDRALNHAMPGSAKYALGMEKSKELAKIPGVVTNDGKGSETVNLDDSNPAVMAVMQKYEAKETPQCQ